MIIKLKDLISLKEADALQSLTNKKPTTADIPPDLAADKLKRKFRSDAQMVVFELSQFTKR